MPVEALILRTPALSPHFQCILRRTGPLDGLTVRVEHRGGADAGIATETGLTLQLLIKNTIGVTVDVEVVAPDIVERSTGKMRRVIDNR